jgi:tRNA(Phe) wybutosine-synthesizing methylase Tyw3
VLIYAVSALPPTSENNYEALEEEVTHKLKVRSANTNRGFYWTGFILPLISMSAVQIATLLVLIALTTGLRYSRVDAAS